MIAILPQHRFPVLLCSIQHDLAASEEVSVQLEFSKQLWDAQKRLASVFTPVRKHLISSPNTEIQHCHFVGECFVQGAMFNNTLETWIEDHVEDIESGKVDASHAEQAPFQPMSFAIH